MSDNNSTSVVVPRIQYIGNGIQTVFETPFPIFKENFVTIYFGNQEINKDLYEIQLDENLRATVIFTDPPSAQTLITIMRNIPIERTSSFQESSMLRSEVLNYEFNYMMACLQQISDTLKRSMVLPPFVADINHDLTLPEPKAGKAIVWTADGTSLENSTVSVNALEKTLFDYKTIAENAVETVTLKANEASSSASSAFTKADEAANSALQAAEAIQNVNGALETKADKDMDNLSEAGKKELISLGMPDYSRGISVNVNATFIPTSNGFIEYKVYCSSSNGGKFFISEDDSNGRAISGLINAASGYIHSAQQVKVLKNKTYYLQNSNSTVDYINFYPMKGE